MGWLSVKVEVNYDYYKYAHGWLARENILNI